MQKFNNDVVFTLPNYPADTIKVLRYLKSREGIPSTNLPSFIMGSFVQSVLFGVWLGVLGIVLAQDQSKYFGSKGSDTFHRCQVDAYSRVPCGHPAIGGAECEALNCCFDQQCYYANEGQ